MEAKFFILFATLMVEVRSEYVPVYGFEGAATTLESGKTLHYYIRLNQCSQRSGRGYPEYADPFGSHVTKWRTFNDRERTDSPYLIFHEQIPVLNRAGRLEQLSRDVKVQSNGSVTVTTTTFTGDYSAMSYQYIHECTMSTASLKGNIDFKASEIQPIRLNGFDEIVGALEAGEYLHFNAMTFLCPGGTEHTFSGLGGHIPKDHGKSDQHHGKIMEISWNFVEEDYEFLYDSSGTVSDIKIFVQTTIHTNLLNNWAAVLDISINRNKTVTIVDTTNSLPNFITTSEHKTYCPLEFGPPGGMFSVYV